MKDKTKSLENLSPKQKAKMEKIEAKLAKRREKERKVIILDNFGKKLIKTFVVIAFLAVLVPFGVVTLSRKSGIEDVSTESAITYATDALSKNASSITYEKKDSAVLEKEVFNFSNGALVSRESFNGDTKISMRKPTLSDIEYVKKQWADKTDDQAIEYINTNDTDYLIITYRLNSDEEYVEESFSLASSNLATFVGKGRVYAEIIAKISNVSTIDDVTVTKASAKIKYNLFGLGYSYEDYKVYCGNSYITFVGDGVTEVYNFGTTTTYTVSVKF